ncbi:hypothetical protein LWI29_005565 [Acer saccharum]|uniref:Uncharacterized protein n=1 Tax=Acer saccharum TaxID=4024 RepID=A0AA39RC94_ACESA|nr:hypothetical protein LWI29_005565 [Acer saccharum]
MMVSTVKTIVVKINGGNESGGRSGALCPKNVVPIAVSSVTDHVEALDIGAKSTDFDDDDGGGLVSHVIITC